MSDRLKPLTEGLGSAFADLERRVQERLQETSELAQRVRTALGGPEKDHVLSASCREDTLIVVCDSAAWCPQIRYSQTQLLTHMNQLRAGSETQFTKLKVRVGRMGPRQ
jgi:hypothetical protein